MNSRERQAKAKVKVKEKKGDARADPEFHCSFSQPQP